jgi:hypothetical protein
MNFLKIKLLVIAVIMFAASSAFALQSYDVTVDTSSLNGDTGYLYLQYATIDKAVASTATVSGFATDGTLGAQDTVDVVNGSAVSGTLPGSVAFQNTNSINDYNQAITFGNTLNFLVSFTSTPVANTPAVSTLSLGLYGDAFGSTPLLNVNDPSISGTVAMINLNNDGNTSATSLDATTNVAPVPEPATCALLGVGLFGLCVYGKRRKLV